MNKAEQNYQRARANLLVMTLLTVLNIILIVADSTISFPFSAIIPQLAVIAGIYLLEESFWAVIVIGISIAAISMAVYFLCYFFSRKYFGWMIGALCLFSLDTLVCLLYTVVFFDVIYLIEIAFHGWVLYYLILGVASGRKLGKIGQDKLTVS